MCWGWFQCPKMYRTAGICLFWARDSFCVAGRLWLICHISKRSCALAIECRCVSSASLSISVSFSVFVVSNAGSSPAKITLLAQAHCHTTTFLWSASPVLFNCLQPITSCTRVKLASTLFPCGMIREMSRATLEWLAYFGWVPSCWRHKLVRSSNQNVLPISIRLEW